MSLNLTVHGEQPNVMEPNAPQIFSAGAMVYPFCLSPLMIEGEMNLAGLKIAEQRDRTLAFFPEMPTPSELRSHNIPKENIPDSFLVGSHHYCSTGVLLRIVKTLNFPDGDTRIMVRGIKRIKCLQSGVVKQVRYAHYEEISEVVDDDLETQALAKNAMQQFQHISAMAHNISEELKLAVINSENCSRLADLLADSLNFDLTEKTILLTLNSTRDRLNYLAILMNRELEILHLGIKLQNDVHEAVSQSQRDFYLREQLKAIQRELKEDARNPDIIEIERRLNSRNLPKRVSKVIEKELSRLEIIPQAAPEYHIAYTYINWLLDMPWEIYSEDTLDVNTAEIVLEADHYGLKDVKERILEFLAVLQLKKNTRKAPILCLVGPPGVGKTSLGQSIARAMNRKFVRFSLGGMRDEAEIRGHRRTYIGAMPGRILQNMKKAGTNNPVFMLDEIDKLASDFRGDPASALLEVLDPEQNIAFNDHYLEIDYDLSRVFFVATANMLETIPGPLQDRMEIIRIPGYTSFEKRQIAKRYLVPRQLDENGLTGKKVRFNLSAIDEIIDYYTREAGVRQLERVIGQVCRKLARRIVEEKVDIANGISIDGAMVNELLGARKFLMEEREREAEVGTVTGLAWTSVGGVILPVQAEMIPGKGLLKLTGSLGKVMQESAEAAYTLVRANAKKWNINPEVFEKYDFHIHVPDGATPKDGPSAGVTITSALVSLLTGNPVSNNLAMTGEINLRGQVTAIGGVREKTIAALRAGIGNVIMPLENRKDALELPDEVKNKLKIYFADRIGQVIDFVIFGKTMPKMEVPKPAPRARQKTATQAAKKSTPKLEATKPATAKSNSAKSAKSTAKKPVAKKDITQKTENKTSKPIVKTVKNKK